ncbi:MAG: DUF1223 domain-containing protein [Pseudomonadota bacterium]
MNVRVWLISAILGIAALPASAEPPRVVELFVSQNCPACPKAEDNIRALKETEPDFLPIVWVVDYWDYLGSPDPMAVPVSSKRQRVYAERFGLRGPYTPQLVMNGMAQTAGNRRGAVRRLLRNGDMVPDDAWGIIEQQDEKLLVRRNELAPEAEFFVLTVTQIERNGGLLENVVTAVRDFGPVESEATFSAADCAGRCIAVLQAMDCGPLLAILPFDVASAEVPKETVNPLVAVAGAQ